MSAALRYDEETSRLELNTTGHSLKSILQAFGDIRQCIQTSRDIREVLSDVGTFFRQMHEIFSRCRVEKNYQGLIILLAVISESISRMDSKQRFVSLNPLLSDILQCLTSRADVRDAAETLLVNMSKVDPELSNSITMEIEHVFVHSRETEMIEAVKNASMKIMGSSVGTLVPQIRSNGVNIKASSEISKPVLSSRRASGIMELTFLPHSITEQWLLARGEEELRYVLEEITAVYNSLQPQSREASKAEMPIAVKHVLLNCSSGEKLVVVNGLKFLASVAQHAVEAFTDDLLDSLFPKLEQYLNHELESIRRGAFRLAVPLVARLSFNKSSDFVLNLLEEDEDYKHFEYVLKISALAILALSKEHLKETNPEFELVKSRVGRIGKAAIKHVMQSRKINSENIPSADTLKPLSLVNESILQYLVEVAKDVLAVTLIVLCPLENPTSDNYPSLLPTRFMDYLFANSGENVNIDSILQAEITIRASGLTFPTLATDSDMSGQISSLLAERAQRSPSQSPSISPAKSSAATGKKPSLSDADYSSLETSRASFNQTWPQNATPDKAKVPINPKLYDSSPIVTNTKHSLEINTNMQHPTLSYVPSWTGAEGESLNQTSNPTDNLTPRSRAALQASMMSPWAPSEPEVDRSKLSALKSSRRKPGSRRAHSAEYTSDRASALGSFASPVPSTSDGVRPTLSKIDIYGADDADKYAALPTSQVGNYLTDTPVDVHYSPVKFPKRRVRKDSEGDMVFETTEYQIALPGREARESENSESYIYNQQHNAGHIKASPRHATSNEGNTVGAQTIPFLKRGEGRARREELMAAANTLLNSDDSEFSSRREREVEREREWSNSIGSLDNPVGLDSILAEHRRSPKRSNVQHSPRGHPHSNRGTAQEESTPLRRAGDLAMRPEASPRYESDTRPNPNKRSPRAERHTRQVQDDNDGQDGGRVAPSALMPESLEYLDTTQIKPCDNAKTELARVLRTLDTDEWPAIFHTLNTVRQLSLHHQNLVLGTSKTTLHGIYQSVLRHADNLRSQVAKNAILTMADMYIGFGRSMDSEVISTMLCLTKKCTDSATVFVGAAAEASICQVIEHATSVRVLTALLNCMDSRNATLRARVSGFLHLLVSTHGSDLRGSREIEVLKSKLANMLNDNTPDARAFSRDIVRQIIDQNICSRTELEQRIPLDVVAKALSMPANGAMSPIRTKLDAQSPARSSFRRAGAASLKNSIEIDRSHDIAADDYRGDMTLNIPSDDEDDEVEVARRLLENADIDDDGLDDSASGHLLLSGVGGESKGKKKKIKRSPKKASTDRDPLESSNDMSGATPSRAKASAAKRIMDRDEDLLSLPDYYVALQSNVWTERRDALTQLSDLMIKHMTVLRDASKLNGCLDRLLETLEDGSVKVVLHALQCISKIQDRAASILSGAQQIVLSAMLNVASSSNKQVCSSATPVLKEILNSFPLQKVIQQLCTIAMHEKDRLKVLSFCLLRDCVTKCYNSSESSSSLIIRKMIFPAICKTVLGNKQLGDVRVAAIEALKEIQRGCPMGEKVSKWADDLTQEEELSRILRS